MGQSQSKISVTVSYLICKLDFQTPCFSTNCRDIYRYTIHHHDHHLYRYTLFMQSCAARISGTVKDTDLPDTPLER